MPLLSEGPVVYQLCLRNENKIFCVFHDSLYFLFGASAGCLAAKDLSLESQTVFSVATL